MHKINRKLRRKEKNKNSGMETNKQSKNWKYNIKEINIIRFKIRENKNKVTKGRRNKI